MEATAVPIPVEHYYRRYGPMVLRRCRALLRNEDDALDAMQETFVRMIRNQERLDDTNPSSLLFRTATHVCLNRVRTLARRQEQPDDSLLEQIASFGDTHDQVEQRSLVSRLFRREADSTRTIALLHLVDGMTLEETANEVGMSVSGVRKRLRRLQDHLATLEGRGNATA